MDNQTIPKKKMTVDEYMKQTNIKSVEEARGYLTQIRTLFIALTVGMILNKVTAVAVPGIASLIVLLYIVLLIYFIFYCVKVKKAVKISKVSAIFCVIFAPFSWIWFYPSIANPLKIIIGSKETPFN